MNESELKHFLAEITPVKTSWQEAVRRRWNTLAKPIGGLGRLEDMVAQLGAIQETVHDATILERQ